MINRSTRRGSIPRLAAKLCGSASLRLLPCPVRHVRPVLYCHRDCLTLAPMRRLCQHPQKTCVTASAHSYDEMCSTMLKLPIGVIFPETYSHFLIPAMLFPTDVDLSSPLNPQDFANVVVGGRASRRPRDPCHCASRTVQALGKIGTLRGLTGAGRRSERRALTLAIHSDRT